jgi:hypothetical protein
MKDAKRSGHDKCEASGMIPVPQLMRMTGTTGAALNFKCPYHANVIKILETNSKPMVITGAGMRFIGITLFIVR